MDYKILDNTSIIIPDDAGRHYFGGGCEAYEFRGLTDASMLNHIASIDLSDINCPIRIEDAKLEWFPLLYPLVHDGGEVQYSLLPNGVIQIHKHTSGHAMSLENSMLPRKRFSLQKLSYEEERLLRAFDSNFDPDKLSNEDQLTVELFGSTDPWRIGGHFETMQGPVWSKCQNPKCSYSRSNDTVSLSPIARITASTSKFGDIWGEWTDEVQFYFGYCPWCYCIHAHNRCS